MIKKSYTCWRAGIDVEHFVGVCLYHHQKYTQKFVLHQMECRNPFKVYTRQNSGWFCFQNAKETNFKKICVKKDMMIHTVQTKFVKQLPASKETNFICVVKR